MTKRIWCQNQLGNIVKTHSAFAAIRHTGDTRFKLEEAKRLGRQYFKTMQANREAMLAMRMSVCRVSSNWCPFWIQPAMV